MTTVSKLPPLERLQELFYVEAPDPNNLRVESGLKRRVYRGGQRPGSWAGSLNGNELHGFYWRVGIDKTLYLNQRVIYFLTHQEDPYPLEIDHIDRNTLNNTVSNLRAVTHKDNCFNKGTPKNNTSGHKGVYWDRDKGVYRVLGFEHKKRIHLGYFDTYEKAVEAQLSYTNSLPPYAYSKA